MTTTSGYAFNGQKLISYSHELKFRQLLKLNGIPFEDTLSIKEIFENINDNHPNYKPVLDKLYFEHVFYGNQKNIYFHNIINKPPSVSSFESNIEGILENVMKQSSHE